MERPQSFESVRELKRFPSSIARGEMPAMFARAEPIKVVSKPAEERLAEAMRLRTRADRALNNIIRARSTDGD